MEYSSIASKIQQQSAVLLQRHQQQKKTTILARRKQASLGQGMSKNLSASLEHFMNTLDRDIEYDLKKSREASVIVGASTNAGALGSSSAQNGTLHPATAFPPPLPRASNHNYSSPHPRNSSLERNNSARDEHISTTSNSEDDDYSVSPSGAQGRKHRKSHRDTGALGSAGIVDIPAEVRAREQRIRAYGRQKRHDTIDFIKRYESLLEERERDRREKWEIEKQYKTQELLKERQKEKHHKKLQLQKEKRLREEQQYLRTEEKLITEEMQLMAEKQVHVDKSFESLTVSCRILPLSVESHMKKKLQELNSPANKNGNARETSSFERDLSPTAPRRHRSSSPKKASKDMSHTSCMRLIQEKPANSAKMTICRVERDIPSHTSHGRTAADDFLFDDYFTESSNVPVQNKIGRSIVECAVTAINSSTFAYGQTGSGKTFSAFGCSSMYVMPPRRNKKLEVAIEADTDAGKEVGAENAPIVTSPKATDEVPIPENPKKEGIIPFVCKRLFQELESRYDDRWTVRISFFEIYQDMTRDLLSKDAEYLKDSVYDDPHCTYETVRVRGVERYTVKNYQQLWKLLRRGFHRRRWSPTDRHDASSRSHTVFSIYTTFFPIRNKPKYILHSKASIVDLSGSEPIGLVKKKIFQDGDAIPAYITQQLEDECLSINRSLLQLEIVLKGIVQQSNKKGMGLAQKNRKNIPYRQSPLTWILGDCLCGNSKTFLLVCVSQLPENVSLSLNALRFATAAGRIQTKVTQNRIELWSSLLRQLMSELCDHTESLFDTLGLLSGALFVKENLQRKRVTLRRMRRTLLEILRLLKQKEIEFDRVSVSRILERELTNLKKRKSPHIFKSVLVMLIHQYEDRYWDDFVDYQRVEKEFLAFLPEEIIQISVDKEKAIPVSGQTKDHANGAASFNNDTRRKNRSSP
mmetsp:Transcript_9737/g.36230  ORF Transcript_9737/g.36230 Transcript_9737/m.36230 type:complete len:922 (-) Transcript_9737:1761-4526(-)|eukprot:CAMPEP_0117452622 /NCGR_PEP_ID=MMETSP0759-20121206/9727_1 /TAXON_ID=63605 /ORGANISM="Percolomonas cosmopolitus, Strain WS" /LENGTH=921 /DNA_ID=CAMNT_0005245477 /DNA_START=77 /DNA_END=2842 /DNA_ORIENTATION=-